MVWQIKQLEDRFVNKNYILSEIVSIMCVLYHFHIENMQNCPLNTEISMNWCRGYYDLVYRPYEDLITPEYFNNTFRNVAAGQGIAQKGIIPKITIDQFMEEVKKPYVNDPKFEVRGSTPAGYIPPITSPDWPVEITEYMDMVEKDVGVDSDTNFSRYVGMKKVLGQELNDKDYDTEYDGSKEAQEKLASEKKEEAPVEVIHDDHKPFPGYHYSTTDHYTPDPTNVISTSTPKEFETAGLVQDLEGCSGCCDGCSCGGDTGMAAPTAVINNAPTPYSVTTSSPAQGSFTKYVPPTEG